MTAGKNRTQTRAIPSNPPFDPPVPNYRQLEKRILAFIEDEATTTFEELALAIHAFQKANCPPLRAFCDSLCPEPSRWQDIPAVPTEAFKNDALPIAAFPVAEASKTFRTSGTTGETRGVHHLLDTTLYEASVRAAWAELELPDLPLVCLSQPPATVRDSSLIHMFATLGGRFAIGSGGQLDPAILERLLARTRRPIVLAGTALAFLHLFESGARLELAAGSYALETGGYKGSGRDVDKTDLYARFEQHLGLAPDRIINEYSMTELSSQFYTTGIGHPHRAPHWLRARVLTPGTGDEVADGETGVLAIYDLANLGSSVAIATRDLASRRGEGFELIGRDPAALPRGCSRAADELLSR